MIWYKKYTLEDINKIFSKNMTSYLSVRAVDLTDDSIQAVMPITDKVKQPYGILHGGASVALAESVGSIASALVINQDKMMAVGMEVNANHLRPKADGEVMATCRPLHLGATTHIWDIRITDEQGKLICVSRLTVAIIKKRFL